MFKNKTIKLFLILGVILFSTILVSCNSSTSNDFYNDFFVEIYDGKIIVGNGEIERFFQLTNKDKQKAKSMVKNYEKFERGYPRSEYPRLCLLFLN